MADDAGTVEGEAHQIEFQKRFRARFVSETPDWYHGLMHLGFTLTVTIGTAVVCWVNIVDASVWEWLIVVPIFLFGNWCEWAGHRWMLHRPVPKLKAIYLRHAGVHHQFFTSHNLAYKGHKEWRALLFPPFAPVMFLLAAAPAALILWAVWSANAGFIVMFTMAAYFIMYEGLHTSAHLKGPRWTWLRYVPLINTVRYMHVAHHDLELMQNYNFNLTLPICDALFGTSTLDRGVLGTLFNGENEKYLRAGIRRETPPPDVGERATANAEAA
ncbi:MAG: fatty acid hydroxylase family protein [Alphaproteobacteria bacterium]